MATTQKKRKKASGGMKLGLIIGSISAILLAAVCILFCIQPAAPADGERWVRIPSGSDRHAVGDSLRAALGVTCGNRVYTIWRIMGGNPGRAHGAYRINNSTSTLTAARRIKNGSQTPVRLTFNYARDISDMASRLTRNLEIEPEALLAACDTILPRHGFRREQFPAAFMPDTYEAYWTDDGERIVDRLLTVRNNFWNDDRRQRAADLGLTPAEAATLASIVEEETGKADERPTVARLYLNRLSKGMLLQADPTVKFATGNPDLRRITGRHLTIQSPYNTYLHHGLPPGPIRIPDGRTIDAVLNAPRHNYIYMCAREDFSGYHNFASDYATHQANARRYRQELDRRGIR